jgi:erythromycin esterase-like protein
VAERKTVRPSLPASLEELFHESGLQEFLVRMDRDHPSEAAEALDCVRLHRAIGVIYRPETERHSHYFHVRAAEQYDAMIHLDVTTALKPLEPTSLWIQGQTPETYPSGL